MGIKVATIFSSSKAFEGEEENVQKVPIFYARLLRVPQLSQTICPAEDGCAEVLIENSLWIFQFGPTDENLLWEAQLKMSNLP